MKNECAREDDVHATTKPNHHLDLLFILHVGTHQVQESFSADEDADDAASQEKKALATEKGALEARLRLCLRLRLRLRLRLVSVTLSLCLYLYLHVSMLFLLLLLSLSMSMYLFLSPSMSLSL